MSTLIKKYLNITLRKKVLRFITLIRESHEEMLNIYTKGSCYNFHLILKEAFYDYSCEPYYNGEHIITKIFGRFYDITGQVPVTGYKPMSEWHKDRALYKLYEDMYVNNYKIQK